MNHIERWIQDFFSGSRCYATQEDIRTLWETAVVSKMESTGSKTEHVLNAAAMAPQDGLRAALVAIANSPIIGTLPGTHLTDAVLMQLAFTTLENIKTLAREALAASPAAQHEAMAPAGGQSANHSDNALPTESKTA